MNNEAAVVIQKHITNVSSEYKDKLVELESALKQFKQEHVSRLDILKKSMMKVCTHSDQKTLFQDDTFQNGHNGNIEGDMYAKCGTCGLVVYLTEYEYNTRIDPFNK
jgi:hypothetical protein